MTRRLAPDASGIAEASDILAGGGLVAFPTETVYGLGADATAALAVARVFEAKGRPRFNPLISHFASARAAFAEVEASTLAARLADRFWPGPLTLVLPRRPSCRIAMLASAGLETLAVRVPAHPVAAALLDHIGRPLAAPSANPSGRISPTTADHVWAGLAGRIDAVLDGGPCTVGLESTVLDLSGEQPVLLRPGGLPAEALAEVAGTIAGPEAGAGAIRAPGQLLSHYAPSCPVRLNAASVREGEALLAFGPPPSGATCVVQLSAAGDLREAAAHLFAGLRELDEAVARLGLSGIAVMPVPEEGLGVAINDRLRRAAAPR